MAQDAHSLPTCLPLLGEQQACTFVISVNAPSYQWTQGNSWISPSQSIATSLATPWACEESGTEGGQRQRLQNKRHRKALAKRNFVYTIILFFKDFIYLFMKDREAETQAEGEKQAPCRLPDAGLDPGTPGPRPDAQPLSHAGVPSNEILKEEFWNYFFVPLLNSLLLCKYIIVCM